jgi:hypothetical protein
MGAVVQLRPARTVNEAWDRYVALVNERHEKNLWADVEHNKRLSDAWQEWSELFQASKGSVG